MRTTQSQDTGFRTKHALYKLSNADMFAPLTELKSKAEKALLKAKMVEAEMISKGKLKRVCRGKTVIYGFGDIYEELKERFEGVK